MPQPPDTTAKPKILERVSLWIKAIWIFLPGIIFLLIGFFVFIKLGQGHDIIYQSTDTKRPWLTGIYFVLATIFWVFTSWYTARLQGYDRNDLYQQVPGLLAQLPRIIAFSILLVLWLAVFLIEDIENELQPCAWLAVGIDFFIYWAVQRFIETPLLVKSKKGPFPVKQRKFLNRLRNTVRLLVIISCGVIVYYWGKQQIKVLLYTLPVIQVGFLLLVIFRYPLYKSNTIELKKKAPIKVDQIPGKGFWVWYTKWIFQTTFTDFDYRFEKIIFRIYNILAILALLCYMLSINVLSFARGLTSFPLVMLSFGVLLGIINIVSVMSHRYSIKIAFLFFVVIILSSVVFETHEVRVFHGNSKEIYARRNSFLQYVERWVNWHYKDIMKDTAKRYPVYFTLADGGASRSGYWAASVLSRLHEGTRIDSFSNTNYHSRFMDHLFCLSGASGGSVGNTSFLAAYSLQEDSAKLRTDSLSRKYLANDFLVYPLARLLGPDIIHAPFGWVPGWKDRAAALEYGMEHPDDSSKKMGEMMQESFSSLLPDDHNQFPILSINTTRVNDGSPGVVSTINIDSSKDIFGTRLDIIDMLDDSDDIRVSTAMVLGARFPYISPAGKVGDKSYFVDGGYFDNSGAGVIHEMLLELQKLKKDDSPIPDSTRNALKQMDFYVIHLTNTPPPNPGTTEKDRINPFVNDLLAPIITLAGSYGSQTTVNDARLTNYLKESNRGFNSYIIYNLYYDSLYENISMNWVISGQALRKMNDRSQKPAIGELINHINDTVHTSDMFRDLIKDQNKPVNQ